MYPSLTTNKNLAKMKKVQKICVYKQCKIKNGDNKGWLFIFSFVLNENTVSTEKQEEIWIEDFNEAREYLMRNYTL